MVTAHAQRGFRLSTNLEPRTSNLEPRTSNIRRGSPQSAFDRLPEHAQPTFHIRAEVDPERAAPTFGKDLEVAAGLSSLDDAEGEFLAGHGQVLRVVAGD